VLDWQQASAAQLQQLDLPENNKILVDKAVN
jgi:hypothetical protein